MTNSKLKIAVLYGSYREKRYGIHVANFVVEQLKSVCNPVLADAKAYDLPILNKMYKEYKDEKPPKNLQKLHELFESADGYVLVTGEYNHGLPAGLKNMLDHFQQEFYFKPAGIVSYSVGGFGGVRASVHARVVLGELGMVTPSAIVPVSNIRKTFDENGKWDDEKLEKSFKKLSDELIWYATALKTARAEGKPY